MLLYEIAGDDCEIVAAVSNSGDCSAVGAIR